MRPRADGAATSRTGRARKVNVRQRTPQRWGAAASGRTLAGERIDLTAAGATEQEARDNLLKKFEVKVGGSPTGLNADSTLHEAAQAWLATKEPGLSRIQPSTYNTYKSLARRLSVTAGAVKLSRLTTPLVDDLVRREWKSKGPAAAKAMRKTLSMVAKEAIRLGAIPYDPVDKASPLPAAEKRESSLTAEGWCEVITAMEQWRGRRTKGGRAVAWVRLRDVLSVCLGLGIRVGEALALRWSDIDFDDGSVRITGTIVQVTGQSVFRQPHTKSRKDRFLPMSALARATLSHRKQTQPSSRLDAVFPSEADTWLAVDRIEKAMRAFRDATPDLWERLDIPLGDVTTHLMRRSAATMVERAGGLGLASSLLGHANEQVTRAHYVTTNRVIDSAAARALDVFASAYDR
ncbi:tyrosine-type recombinase/integrase [Microbacterium paludicola]|uniref:tyrosine-type recombinase/integrase n=1 Tax=Microbacterium paludicola TaxID=300019 RepID=UPI00387981ED